MAGCWTAPPAWRPTGTPAQLLETDGGGTRRELVRGEVRETAPAGLDHGRIALRPGARIDNHVESTGAGGRLDGADVLPGLRIAVDDLFS